MNPPLLNVFTLVQGATLEKRGAGIALVEMNVSNTASTVLLENNNSTLDVLGDYTVNLGSTRLQGGTLHLTGSSTQTGSLTSLQGGLLSLAALHLQLNSVLYLEFWTVSTPPNGSVNLASGALLAGSGTVQSNLFNSGRVRVGELLGAGTLTVQGNYTQGQDGKLEIEIGGANPGTQYDRLNITGNATLAGTLILDVINGYNPRNNGFDILLIGGTLNGTFVLDLLPAAQLYVWTPVYSNAPMNNSVRLNAT